MRRRSILTGLATLTFAAIMRGEASACLWDVDTKRQEAAPFPGTLELITGKFARHSRAFYEWRIKNRLARLEREPKNVAFYDDLAVAYDKVGRHDDAIEMMGRKEQITPGLYETEANLGTFLIHSGKFSEGLKHVERAIEINRDAHFGREKYQIRLVEYILAQGFPKRELPLQSERECIRDWSGFARYAMEEQVVKKGRQASVAGYSAGELKELDRALQGVQGMMRFSQHDSPILLEAMASLLLQIGQIHEPNPNKSGFGKSKPNSGQRTLEEGPRNLAVKAMLKASYVTREKAEISKRYQDVAASILAHKAPAEVESGWPDSIKNELKTLVDQFSEEVLAGEAWFKQVEEDEARWISSGADVEQLFADKYLRPSGTK